MTDQFITDIHGIQRHVGGLLLPPTGFVSAMPVFEDNVREWTDAEIREAVTDPNRKLGRKLFGPEWTHDQGAVGACNGWAAAGAYARARFLRGIADKMQFSGSWLYSLMNGGRDNGSALEDGLVVGMREGFAEISLVPPNQIWPHQMPRLAEAKASAAQHKSFKAYAVKTKQGYRTALAKGFPVIVAVMAGNGFQHLSNGVNGYGISGVDNGPGNHAVLTDDLVILPDGREVYDLQNSWGTRFGDNGRTFVTWASLDAPFRSHLFYAIASTEEGA